MSGRPRARISIPGEWVAVARAYDDAASRNPELSTDVRLLAAARSRMNFNGHAHFKRGELRVILARLNTTTGELGPLDSRTVTRAVDGLVGGDLLAAGSWSECLALPPFSVQSGNRNGDVKVTPCPRKPNGCAANLAP